jgi:pyruvate formate lyase activating enzyme
LSFRSGPDYRDGNRGLVFDIQRFSVHDGPGIRTTVFMKGCPLRCLWCSNPESQELRPVLMVRDVNCRQCGACRQACPEAAISVDEDNGRAIDWAACSQCLECAEACLYDALTACGKVMEVEAIVDEVLRDEDFYRNSGGGVTVSGGEPLTQSEFVSRLLEECKERGLHTAVETSGYGPWERMETILHFTDLILFDVKHLESLAHSRATGVPNDVILENLERASAVEGQRVWIRIPLISDFNDSGEHIEKIAELGRKLGVEKISLLPYHEGGRSKCRQLGRPYGYPEGRAPSKEHLKHLKKLLEQRGLTVTVDH